MPLLLNENAPIDAAIFLLEAAVVAGLVLGGFLLYAPRKRPAAGPHHQPQLPGSRVPWLVVWPGLAAAYLLYLLSRLVGS